MQPVRVVARQLLLGCPCLARGASRLAIPDQPSLSIPFIPATCQRSFSGGQAGVPPILFRPSSVSGPVALVTTAARGMTPLGAITAAGVNPRKNPPHLPCSQSDIRLAAAVTDGAGGLLHHPFTHHREAVPVAPACRLVRSLLQLSSGVNPCLDLLFRPVTMPLGAGSREVPLGIYPSDGPLTCP